MSMTEAKPGTSPAAAAQISRPSFAMPPLACDTHMHVFGPLSQYPKVPDALYPLPDADLDQYVEMARSLGIERMVFVQPSFYGTDNSCLLHALKQMRGQCRGVVFLDKAPAAALIDDLHRHGVRGLRLDLFKARLACSNTAEIRALLNSAARLAKSADWHLELYSPGRVNRDLLGDLDFDVDVCINHMGYMKQEDGLTDEDFRWFLDIAKRERCWIKLTGTYRIVHDDSTERTDWMARELIAAAPDRVLWGTDWPHVMHSRPDTGALLQRLQTWCPDAALRNRILSSNPARLYKF